MKPSRATQRERESVDVEQRLEKQKRVREDGSRDEDEGCVFEDPRRSGGGGDPHDGGRVAGQEEAPAARRHHGCRLRRRGLREQMLWLGRVKLEEGLRVGKFKPSRNEYTESQFACSLSHLTAIKRAYDDNAELALILEDDVSVPASFLETW